MTAPVPVVPPVAEPTAMMAPVATPEEEEKKRSPWLWVAIGAGVLLLAIGAIALASTLFGTPRPRRSRCPRSSG